MFFFHFLAVFVDDDKGSQENYAGAAYQSAALKAGSREHELSRVVSGRSVKCDKCILIDLIFGRRTVDKKLPAIFCRDRGDDCLILVQIFDAELCISVGNQIGTDL